MRGGHNAKRARNAAMVADYRAHGMTWLADHYHISLSTVHRILTREGVPKRPRGHQPAHSHPIHDPSCHP